MAQSISKIQAKLMREYYKYFSKYAKGKKPDCKIAWVTSFTPVEILEALNISYYYPESYAAVIAASEKEQPLLLESERQCLSRDCCSYACCIEGCLEMEEGPRGVPPIPDVLIATNNQCNTLPNWWNILAERFQIPLIVLDYPGETSNKEQAYHYVTEQHKDLISKMEQLSGNKLEISFLERLISNSRESVFAWTKMVDFMLEKGTKITSLFDDINFLITSRCKEQTAELYSMMAEEIKNQSVEAEDELPVFWMGYPLWYHKDRYLSELLSGCRIAGSNYITWWNLDYSGSSAFEALFHAYNFTFLNLSQKSRTARLTEQIRKSNARCAIALHNKSCKCDFVSAMDVEIPQAEIEIDMIDREFLDIEKARRQIALLREIE